MRSLSLILAALFALMFTAPAQAATLELFSVEPTATSLDGGEWVTLYGTGFDVGGTSVTLDGELVDPASVEVISSEQLRFMPPSVNGPRSVDIQVIANSTSSNAVFFSYLDMPTASELDVVMGPMSGGTLVMVAGSNFVADFMSVEIGGQMVPATVNDSNILTFITPPLAGGPQSSAVKVNVSVVSAGGATDFPLNFSYLPAPTAASLSATKGPLGGLASVTITGENFESGGTRVLVDGDPASIVSDDSPTSMTFVMPSVPSAKNVGVVVETPGGASMPLNFDYVAAPDISSMSPNEGVEGTPVTIEGIDLGDATAVTFGGEPGTDLQASQGQITVKAPANGGGATDPVTVTVQHPGGDRDAGSFKYLPQPNVSSISPNSGPVSGGSRLTISGTGFSGTTGVTFGGIPGTDFTLFEDSFIFVTTPPHVAGSAPIVFENSAGNVSAGSFNYLAQAIGTISPIAGSSAGGTLVTIKGSGLAEATRVWFGQATGTDLEKVSDNEIRVRTPAGSAGAVNVFVSTVDNGISSPQQFTYGSPPSVTSMSHTYGPEMGMNTILLEGNFNGVTGVLFGDQRGYNFNASSGMLQVTVPAGTGVVDVVLEPYGDQLGLTYTYLGTPVISSVEPNTGTWIGGTPVTIKGSKFSGATGVNFGDLPGTSFSVVSDTEISVTTPEGSGIVNVQIGNPESYATAEGAFTYLTPPEVTSYGPDEGTQSGGTVVTVTGSGFDNLSGVMFGTDPGSLSIISDSEIEVTAPAGTGTVVISLQGSGGDVDVGNFTYRAPDIDSFTPISGAPSGGTQMTITGVGFTDATGVTFDGRPGIAFTVISDTEVTVQTPDGNGAVDVVVQRPAGDLTATQLFTYGPLVASKSMTTGPAAGGTPMTISGSGFINATGVKFGSVDGTAFTVDSDNQISVTSPAGAGTVGVVVVHPIADADAGEFTYIASAVPTSIVPNEGATTGGTPVTIYGSGFTAVTGVTFDGNDGTAFSVVDDGEITVTTPAGTAGARLVMLKHPLADASAGNFTYLQVPEISSLSPNEGPESGGTPVTISGVGFTDATGVTFDGNSVGFNVDSDTQITVSSTPAGSGTVDVVVQSDIGDSEPAEFTYLAPPEVTSMSFDEGPEAGGTPVVIQGSGFVGATGVTFGGTTGVDFVVVSDQSIMVTSPAGTGVVDVIVEHPNGDAEAGEFTYLKIAGITQVSPASGAEEGGTAVTITGVNFIGATRVLFDGTEGVDFVVDSDTQISVTTPPGSGAVDVVVEHPNGDSAAGIFTYLAPVPVIDSMSPQHGPAAGGTDVTILGSGFIGMADVLFDGVSASSFSVVSDTELTAKSPAGTGSVNVTLVHGNGNVLAGTFTYDSAPLVPQDSIDVGKVANQMTMRVSQVSGSALTASIGKGIAIGFGAAPTVSANLEQMFIGYTDGRLAVDDAFNEVMAQQPDGQVSMWLDTKASGVLQALAGDSEGWQVNINGGIGYRVSKDVLIGVLAGYERFEYQSSNPQGQLSGSGATVGAYAGVRTGEIVGDIAAAYTALGYDVSSGAAFGSFGASRLLVTGGVSGMVELGDLVVRPSARVDAQWETQEAWRDTLDSTHDSRQFGTARLSVGGTISQEMPVADGLSLTPYLGLYGDMQGSWDSAASVDGSASARVTAGIEMTTEGGASVSAGGELGGLGTTAPMWSLTGGVSGRF